MSVGLLGVLCGPETCKLVTCPRFDPIFPVWKASSPTHTSLSAGAAVVESVSPALNWVEEEAGFCFVINNCSILTRMFSVSVILVSYEALQKMFSELKSKARSD